MATFEKSQINGVTLKRTTAGYTWDIHVAAKGNEAADLRAAVQVASEIDMQLVELYASEAATKREPKVAVAPVSSAKPPKFRRSKAPF